MLRTQQSTDSKFGQQSSDFGRDGYQVLRGVLPAPMCQFIANYFVLLVANNYMVLDDGQVEKGYGGYGLPLSETLLETLRPTVTRVADAPLFSTYSYARVYLKGAVLERHTDRPACEVSCSVTIDFDSTQPWPFCLETRDGRPQQIAMGRGDALVYSGPEVPHWREAFLGDSQLQIFLHYVRQDGPNAHLRYDRRPRLGAPQSKELQRDRGNQA